MSTKHTKKLIAKPLKMRQPVKYIKRLIKKPLNTKPIKKLIGKNSEAKKECPPSL